MAMGYFDDVASVAHCHSGLGNYDGKKYCDYDDHLSVCGAQHYHFINMVACSCLLLYDRLLYRCYMPHDALPMGYQAELYASMAEAYSTHPVCIYAGSWEMPL